MLCVCGRGGGAQKVLPRLEGGGGGQGCWSFLLFYMALDP